MSAYVTNTWKYSLAVYIILLRFRYEDMNFHFNIYKDSIVFISRLSCRVSYLFVIGLLVLVLACTCGRGSHAQRYRCLVLADKLTTDLN